MTKSIDAFRRYPGRGNSRLRVLLILVMTAFTMTLFSQNLTVRGKVTDAETGEAMIGLNVVIRGTTRGVATDLEGNYSVADCPPDATLVFSFVGYDPVEVPVRGRTLIDVTISPSSELVEDVVVIGYGTVSRKDVMGSITSVQGEELARVPVSSAVEALTGKMAGVHIVTTEGSPDADINIRVRGGGSVTQSSTPLFIVDGFPVNSITDIPPSIIQSIDVLKDASSTAIYGARGANGVIIITTKAGEVGKPRVSYNAYYGFKKVSKQLPTISVPDYMRWQYEYALLDDNLENYERYFGNYQDIDLYEGQPSTNWFDQVFGHIGKVFNHDLNVSGGSDNFKYSVSYAGIRSDEIMLSSNYRRDNLALKLDHKAGERVELSFSVRYSDLKIFGAGATDQGGATPNDARVKQTMLFVPIPFNSVGDFDDTDLSASMTNPLDNVRDNDRQQFRKRFNLGASFSWEIVDGLVFRTEAGLDNYVNNDDRFYGLTTYYVRNTPTADYQNKPALESYERKGNGIRSTNTLTYDFKDIFGDSGHSLRLLAGQEVLINESNTMFNQVWGFPEFFTGPEAFKLVSQGFSNSYTNTLNPDDKLLSFFGRFMYDYMGRYQASATFRADGSSKFSATNRWGYFPSASVAWRISEEEFMKGISNTLNNLRLRFSYGTAGDNNIPSNQIAQIFEARTTSWINGFSSFWAPSTNMANPDLKWETTVTRNLGLDFGLFRNRINGSVELYRNNTKDLLIQFPVSGTGYTNQYRNMGETQNKGIELELNAVALNEKNYGLTFGFNIAFNRNEILSLGVMNDFGQNTSWASTEIGNDYWVAVGGSVGTMYGYINDGRYEVSDFSGYDSENEEWILNDGVVDNSNVIGTLRPGSLKLRDLTGDGLVTVADVTEIGNSNPKHTGGFTAEGYLFGFDFAAFFNWSAGNQIYNANKIEYTTSRYPFRNLIDIMAEGKRWTNLDPATGTLVNDPATLASMNTNTTMWSPFMSRHVFSDWAVEDGSFLRLNTLTLGYSIPEAVTSRLRIERLRFYVSGYNVFVLTNYSGFDPEVSARRNTALTPGLDYSAYPKSRQVMFGANLTF
ncbi:MAG TPA: SusC/RagA family protein [Bacteroidales bacterium]|nr:SusC/RagA family protein [Bacteroidales bacterium]